jgi:hypothetical protein
MYPFLKKLFADGAYQGPQFHTALTKLLPQLETEIIKRARRPNGGEAPRILGRDRSAGLQSFRGMRRIDARRKNASVLRLRFSQS